MLFSRGHPFFFKNIQQTWELKWNLLHSWINNKNMVTLLIIILTVMVSMVCFNSRTRFDKLAFSAYRVVHANEWYRIVTHGFVHADWVHLFVNMFTFYSFGTYLEQWFRMMGFSTASYLLLYFGGMIAASVYDLVKYNKDLYYVSIGASGAVSSVLFMAIFLNPWDKIYLFAAIPIPGIVFGFVYLFYCQYMAKRGGDHINHNAHFYGALYGFLYPLLLEPSLWHEFVRNLLRH